MISMLLDALPLLGGFWPAPHAAAGVHAHVSLPGSKSLTNRWLVLAALAAGPSTGTGVLRARDTDLMMVALGAFGARVEPAADDPTMVHVIPGPLLGGSLGDPLRIDCGLAGTVMRFVPMVAALAAGSTMFDGDPRARERPMLTTLTSLRGLGVSVGDAQAIAGSPSGRLPFTVHGTGALRGTGVTASAQPLVIDSCASSQFVSGLLLIAARTELGLSLSHRGAAMPSVPHVVMTLAALRARGVDARWVGAPADDPAGLGLIDGAGPVLDPTRLDWTVAPGPIAALDEAIEPDLSNAGPFVAAAAVTGGQVRVHGWPLASTQPGFRWPEILAEFGCDVVVLQLDSGRGHSAAGLGFGGSGELVVQGPDVLVGVDLDLSAVGELTPVVAAIAACASTASTLRGIGHLRGHETDRLVAIATELTALGARVEVGDDFLVIHPGVLRVPADGRPLLTYGDHRMVHLGAVLGLVTSGLRIADVETVAKTMPDFTTRWQALIDQTSVGGR